MTKREENQTITFALNLFALIGFMFNVQESAVMDQMALTANNTQKENKMTRQDLANFYNISTQAVGRWSKDRKHRKTVQALSGAEQEIVDLIADISKLVFIFNCKWLHGEVQVKCQEVSVEHYGLFVTGTEYWGRANMNSPDVVEQLQVIKTKLEELVYGVSSVD